ncbi:MAG TPA: glycosyltransferase, partial [Acidimicrobiales bacterium]|nr:glycosyltransferase [Acidimicrobiales bacterium]
MRTIRSRSRGAGSAPAGTGRRVLVVSASMGAGHDGAARELARRIEAAGHHAEVRDLLDAGPLRIGAALRGGYELELRHAPGAYDATYRLWHRVPWLCPLVAWLVCVLTRRRVLRWVRRGGADVVVSTYPLATLCLGRLRRLGRLRVPAVNFITDFGVHPLWVHRGIDLHLAVHAEPAAAAAARTGRPAVACGPLVGARFEQADGRAATRTELALADADRAVLVVAGSWGVGDIEATITDVAACGAVPVVVCGRDATLERRVRNGVASAGLRAVVIGWTDRMPHLMVACDALVENAGGLTAFEAMRAGLPVISYRPIAGHGVENTAAMHAAGVSTLATDRAALAEAITVLAADSATRRGQVAAGVAMFRADGPALVLGAKALPVARPRLVAAAAGRAASVLVALCGAGWIGLTSGVGVAAAAGAGVAHAPAGGGNVVYLGARLDAAELADPSVAAAVESLHASVVVDARTAAAAPGALRSLSAAGVTVVDGGAGWRRDADGERAHPAPWNRAEQDVTAAGLLARVAGAPVSLFAPGR